MFSYTVFTSLQRLGVVIWCHLLFQIYGLLFCERICISQMQNMGVCRQLGCAKVFLLFGWWGPAHVLCCFTKPFTCEQPGSTIDGLPTAWLYIVIVSPCSDWARWNIDHIKINKSRFLVSKVKIHLYYRK